MKHFVYILKGKNNSTYTGCTNDLEDRISRHNRGSVPATKHLRPLNLVTYIVFNDKHKAYEFEKYLKTGSGRAFLKKRFI